MLGAFFSTRSAKLGNPAAAKLAPQLNANGARINAHAAATFKLLGKIVLGKENLVIATHSISCIVVESHADNAVN
jgi:hypothetical protein